MTLIELVAGVAVYMVLGSLIFAMLLCLKAPVEQWLGTSVASIIGGFFEGGVISVLMVIHMAKSVEESILLNEKEALKQTRIAQANQQKEAEIAKATQEKEAKKAAKNKEQ